MSASQFRVPPPGTLPLPTPEHQRKITRNKWFEIGTVVLLIVAGFGFLSFRNYRSTHHVDPAATLSESAQAIGADGATPVDSTAFFNRTCQSFRKHIEGFECHIDLIGKGADMPLETALIWLTVLPGKEPSPETFQLAVNSVGSLGQTLVFSSAEALEKAAKTMVYVSATQRPHDKGVAGTNDGWKVTYATFRQAGGAEPALCLVLQRLSAASDPELSDFNRALYETLQQGGELKGALAVAGTAVGKAL